MGKGKSRQFAGKALKGDLAHWIKEGERIAARAGMPEAFNFFFMGDGVEHWSLKGEPENATLRLNGLIHWAFVDAEAVVSALDDLEPENLTVLINSPGGILTDGLALYEDLRARARDGMTLETETRGVVASAATLPYIAGNARRITEGSSLMIHEAHMQMVLSGNSEQIKDEYGKAIKALDHQQSVLAKTMAKRTGNSVPQMQAWMSEELWMSGEEAIDNGFATAMVEDNSASEEVDEDTDETTSRAEGVSANALERVLAGIQRG